MFTVAEFLHIRKPKANIGKILLGKSPKEEKKPSQSDHRSHFSICLDGVISRVSHLVIISALVAKGLPLSAESANKIYGLPLDDTAVRSTRSPIIMLPPNKCATRTHRHTHTHGCCLSACMQISLNLSSRPCAMEYKLCMLTKQTSSVAIIQNGSSETGGWLGCNIPKRDRKILDLEIPPPQP